MPLLSCVAVTRRPFFEGRTLLVEAGEIVVLQGPTGAGKTLFLRAIGDLDPLAEGTYRLGEDDRTTMAPAHWRRSVLYVHQSAPRFPGRVGDNLQRIAELRNVATTSPAIPLPPLDPDKEGDRLSGGEAQLLALHRALLVGPRVMLLDESTSALDRDRGRMVEEALVEWTQRGHAIVWVSHENALADRLGARREAFP